MSLTLGISTSSTDFEAVLGDNSQVLFSSKNNLFLDDTKDIALLVSESLAQLGLTPHDIKNITVDIGPGGTSLVRTGVAYANGLAYSLGIPVCPVLSVELVGLEAWEKYQLPVICTAKSMKDNAYVALYSGKLLTLKYGVLKDVVSEVVSGIDEFVVAGTHRAQLIELFPHKKVHDSGIQFGQTKFLIEKNNLFSNRNISFPNFVIPITEQSIFVYD